MRALATLALVAAFATTPTCFAKGGYDDDVRGDRDHQGSHFRIETLSTKPELVSGGDVLVRIELPHGVSVNKVRVELNNRNVSGAFSADAKGRTLTGLVTGLKRGKNVLEVSASGKHGGPSRRLLLTNHPISGPLFSGPHQTPFVCETEAWGLGPALDANCSANTTVAYRYRSTDNTFKPFDPSAPTPGDLQRTTTSEGNAVDYIVRLETGTINRAVYQIAFLHVPGTPLPTPWHRTTGWNKRLAYTFGGGCSAGYHQATSNGGVLDNVFLARGYAVASSSQNVWGNNCNDLITAETALMVKEYFIERFGVPRYTMGFGGSGGSMQQHMIAQNYPGILDGITPSASYPDIFTVIPPTIDCSLLKRVFDSSSLPWTFEQKSAVAGYASWNNCEQIPPTPVGLTWIATFSPGWVVPTLCSPVVPQSAIYNAQTNPGGVRCTIHDNNVNALGIDPRTGFARRPLDNVGVQYGLVAFKAGVISAEQFIELNERIGGFDADGNIVGARSVADTTTLRLAYSRGRVNTGGGGLGSVPIVDFRAYWDKNPDIHDRVRSLMTRERLIAANGHADNQVLLLTASLGGIFTDIVTPDSPWNRLVPHAVLQMERWLDNITSDRSRYHSKAEKVLRNKPTDLVDACFTADGQEIREPASDSKTSQCNQLYPVNGNPRLAAGGPLADNVLKCRLKPVKASDYGRPLAAAQIVRLNVAFPEGVCDYDERGVGQGEVKDTWLAYPQPGVAVKIDDDDRDGRH
jgi:hypothetical protein